MASPSPVHIGDATLYLGDCLEIMPTLQKGAIDAVVTDPPYGIGYVYGGGRSLDRKAPVNCNPIIGDDKPFDPGPLIELAGDKPLLMFGASHYKTRLPDGGVFLCWDKSCGQGPADAFADAEFAWMNRKNARCIYRHLWKGFSRSGDGASSRSSRRHPSQKPIELMRWCLETARIGIGKVVLDPYMGTGSTGVACVTSGRKFIGIKIDPGYFEIACSRIEKAQQQAQIEMEDADASAP